MPSSRRRLLPHYTLFPPHMRPMFFGTLLYNIADQMVGTFLPLFLFGIGKNLHAFDFFGLSPFVSGVLFVIMYYCLQRLVILVSAVPLGHLIVRWGHVSSMIVGTLLLCGNYIGFYLAKLDPLFLAFSFVCGGLSLILYWVAHDSLFAQEISASQIGRGVGALSLLTKITRIAIPAAGGLVIAFLGYQVFFVVGLVFLLASIFPFLLIPKSKIHAAPSLPQFLTWLHEARFRRFALVQMGVYMDIVAMILWPIYVILFVGRLERVGFLFSFVILLSLVLTYLAGWLIDRKKARRWFLFSGLIVSLSWGMRMFVRGVWDIVGVELMDKLGASVYSPCYDSFLCQRSKGKSVVAFYIYKEILLSISAIILWSTTFILFLLPAPWTGVFLLGAVGIFLSLFLDGSK